MAKEKSNGRPRGSKRPRVPSAYLKNIPTLAPHLLERLEADDLSAADRKNLSRQIERRKLQLRTARQQHLSETHAEIDTEPAYLSW